MAACHGCGVVKDRDVLEVCAFAEELGLTDTPIDPLAELDCQGYAPFEGQWKAVTVCYGCFRKLNPDMWISSDCWARIDPVTPFEALPDMLDAEGHRAVH